MFEIVTPTHANMDRQFIESAISEKIIRDTAIKPNMIKKINIHKEGGGYIHLAEEPKNIPARSPEDILQHITELQVTYTLKGKQDAKLFLDRIVTVIQEYIGS